MDRPSSVVLLQPRLLDAPMVALSEVSMDDANRLLTLWGHKLGQVHRPFTTKAYTLELDGNPISVAVSASTITATMARGALKRCEVVELARQCSAPSYEWATRPIVRLWREVCAPRWPDWPVRAAVSYSHNAMHRGDIYRFDGWLRVQTDAGAKHKMKNHGREAYGENPSAYGAKTLWAWCYDDALKEVLTMKMKETKDA